MGPSDHGIEPGVAGGLVPINVERACHMGEEFGQFPGVPGAAPAPRLPTKAHWGQEAGAGLATEIGSERAWNPLGAVVKTVIDLDVVTDLRGRMAPRAPTLAFPMREV
ncbi:MAG: hypothetical protein KY456_09720 [Chloroflexi bacterium]|nr:hypothetical protein [Chloroflexota bacterium]